MSSVTRLGDLLYFGYLLKACGNNYFAQIAPTFLGIFCKGFKNFHFSSEIFLGNFYDIWQFFTGRTGYEQTFLTQHCVESLWLMLVYAEVPEANNK